VLAALLHHRAAGADLDGGCVALVPRRSTLALGVEEELRVRVPAGSIELPFPDVGDRNRKS
jgi:hypothetical protein